MTDIKHLVEYDEGERKIVILRLLEGGSSHLYTEIPLNEVSPSQRTLEGLGRILGEALILDMNRLRDEVVR